MTEQEFEEKLIVGAKIKIGKQYAQNYGFKAGEVITLVDGSFEYDNGLYTENQSAPAIWNEGEKEFDSIYHLFGNHFETFLDCEVIS